MQLTETFTVTAGIDATWELLTDVERVAPCVPGFTLSEAHHPDYRGVMKIKVGAITVQYDTTITFAERDDAARRVVLAVHGRELRGAGSVDATVTAHLGENAGQTTAEVVTDVQVTGRVAQFGRGIIADVSSRMTQQFVARLDQALAASSPGGGTQAASAAGAAAADTLDLASVAGLPLLKRIVPVALGLALAVALARRRPRRRRSA